MPGQIDLRSDTVTKPTAEMRQLMVAAEVGDDVWGEDPTVVVLQQRVSQLLGKEAALFVPSGTMANQIALRLHTCHGDEVLQGWGSHVSSFESGAAAAFSGVQLRTLGEGGTFTADQLGEALLEPNVHLPPQRLVWLENTHNRGGGQLFPQSAVEAIAELAHGRGLAVHLDGARLLHAAVALGRPAAELVAPVDSTSICLSKGLGAPVGSVLAGSRELMTKALRLRKMFGGGMRQVGILAAAGLYALDHHIDRLAEDHRKARGLAEGLAAIPGIVLDAQRVQTNIVIFELSPSGPPAAAFLASCAERGLLLSLAGPRRIRAVTHLDVSEEACLEAVPIIKRVLG